MALDLGTTALTAVVVGVLTAVGGGVVRDLLAGGPPRILVERELYAIPAILGAVSYASLWSAGLDSPLTTWGCVVLTVTVRILALGRNWQAPAPTSHGAER